MKQKKAITSVRQCLTDRNAIITKIMLGRRGDMVRIDARTRNYIADMDNFFSAWVKLRYANALCREIYGQSLVKKFEKLIKY